MIDLKLFFSGVPAELYADIRDPHAMGRSMHIHGETFPELEGIELAIIGITENRHAGENVGVNEAANAIRKKLYRLKRSHSGTLKLVDLGNISLGMEADDTLQRLSEVCKMLMEMDILPIIIGGSNEVAYGQYLAYEDLGKLVTVAQVDAFLDMEDDTSLPENRRHAHRMLMHEPNYLFNYVLLGYQSYLVNQEAISVLERLYFQSHRLGKLREDVKEAEPLIRDADLLSFDITAIRGSDAPGNQHAQPFGFSGEEACQLCWYAGLSEKLSSISFSEYNPELDDGRQNTAAVVATMVWYFIEGYYNRRGHVSFTSNDYKRYIVSMPTDPSTLTFFKSQQSEKWWMEVPYPQGQQKSLYERNYMVPCSYADYLTAVNGELPERWINTYAKLI